MKCLESLCPLDLLFLSAGVVCLSVCLSVCIRIGRMYRASHSYPVDVHPAHVSSVSHLLRFRRRTESVRETWVYPARCDAPCAGWHAVCPLGSIRTRAPWTHWVQLDLHGCFMCVIGAMEAVTQFVQKVADVRQEEGVWSWARWKQ